MITHKIGHFPIHCNKIFFSITTIAIITITTIIITTIIITITITVSFAAIRK